MTRREFWRSPVGCVVSVMRARGNKPSLIAEWVALAHQWALDHNTPEAAAIRAWLPLFQPRPFYSARELAPLFPALIVALGFGEKPPQLSAGLLENMLNFSNGLPVLQNANGSEWFCIPGEPEWIARYYIVERLHYWKDKRLTQEEFENVYHG